MCSECDSHDYCEVIQVEGRLTHSPPHPLPPHLQHTRLSVHIHTKAIEKLRETFKGTKEISDSIGCSSCGVPLNDDNLTMKSTPASKK